jgi:uncharacterized membrane protein YphA (DoxX/SURF4 family)
MKPKSIAYWTTTILISLALLSGGIGELLRPPDAVKGMARIGYPAYVMTILGVWKILGFIAILIPRYPRLKEWAYAGIFFDLTGAAISHAASADYGAGAFHIIVPLAIAAVAMASWATRPSSRELVASQN